MEYDDRNLLKDIAVLRDGFDSVRRELAKVIVGQENVIEKVLSASSVMAPVKRRHASGDTPPGWLAPTAPRNFRFRITGRA